MPTPLPALGRPSILLLFALASACSSPGEPPGGVMDGAASEDAAVADRDGSVDRPPDAAPPLDAGPVDAGTPPDAGPPRCSGTPDCAGASPSATERWMAALDGCAFALDAPTDGAAADARIDALLARTGGARTVEDVLGHLNREGREGISADSAERMRNHEWTGFRWNDGDENVTYWYPQGITGSSDAREGGRVNGRRLLLVSWYHKTTARPTKGARVSLVDITDPSAIRYRHLLLVTPTGDADAVDFGPAEYDGGNALHVGGIVWIGDRLYVADTSVGLRVFDMSRIVELTNTDDTDRIGLSGARSDAHGYRYAVPQLARYRLASDSCRIRFSFVALDRSEAPPVLVTGEYRADDPGGRVARWQVDPSTGWLIERDGVAHAIDAAVGAQTRMQGAVTFEGVHYFSSSSQYMRWGRLYRSRPGLESEITAWPYGCEDLYVERAERLVWTATEHPPIRDTLGIPLQGR